MVNIVDQALGVKRDQMVKSLYDQLRDLVPQHRIVLAVDKAMLDVDLRDVLVAAMAADDALSATGTLAGQSGALAGMGALLIAGASGIQSAANGALGAAHGAIDAYAAELADPPSSAITDALADLDGAEAAYSTAIGNFNINAAAFNTTADNAAVVTGEFAPLLTEWETQRVILQEAYPQAIP